jgi:sugar lactone lactonase YvrE
MGQIVWTNLPYGNYVVKETTIPVNYTASQTTWNVTVDGTTPNVTINAVNTYVPPQKGSITLVKTDADTNAAISGAYFQLWVWNETAWQAVGTPIATNASGQIVWTGLGAGAYCVTETQAAPGYELGSLVVNYGNGQQYIELAGNANLAIAATNRKSTQPPPPPPDGCWPMYEPMDVVTSLDGRTVYFLDTDNHLVRSMVLQSDGSWKLVEVAGAYQGNSAGAYYNDGNPRNAKFAAPQGIAIDKNNVLYIADTNNNVIRRISADRTTIITIAGIPGYGGFSGDNGPAASAELYHPVGLAVDANATALYIADMGNHRIRKIDLLTGIITTVAGTGTPSVNSATSEGVGDGLPATQASLYFPHDVAIDAYGNLYIADSANNRIRKVSGGVITTIAGNGYNNGLNAPKGVAVDAAGNVYVSDSGNNIVKKYIPSGGGYTMVPFAGTGVGGFNGENGTTQPSVWYPATSGQVYYPRGIHADAFGNVYFADEKNGAVRVVAADGSLRTVVGNGVENGYTPLQN